MPEGDGRASDRMSAMPLPPAKSHVQPPAVGNDRGSSLAPPFRAATGTREARRAANANDTPWQVADQGEVHPAFREDVLQTTAAIRSTLPAKPPQEFPVDAFIIPEDTRRIPTGLDETQVEAVMQNTEHPRHDPVHDLADRFEKLSRRLRSEELDSLLPSLTRGDRFDLLLAGFLAGYFSARDA